MSGRAVSRASRSTRRVSFKDRSRSRSVSGSRKSRSSYRKGTPPRRPAVSSHREGTPPRRPAAHASRSTRRVSFKDRSRSRSVSGTRKSKSSYRKPTPAARGRNSSRSVSRSRSRSVSRSASRRPTRRSATRSVRRRRSVSRRSRSSRKPAGAFRDVAGRWHKKNGQYLKTKKNRQMA